MEGMLPTRTLVKGSAKLNGTLDITSLNNFHPSSGNSYELLSATGGVSGEFSTISDTANTAGLSRLDFYGPNGVLVTYLPPGLGVCKPGRVHGARLGCAAESEFRLTRLAGNRCRIPSGG